MSSKLEALSSGRLCQTRSQSNSNSHLHQLSAILVGLEALGSNCSTGCSHNLGHSFDRNLDHTTGCSDNIADLSDCTNNLSFDFSHSLGHNCSHIVANHKFVPTVA